MILKAVMTLIFLSSFWLASYSQVNHNTVASNVKLFAKGDSMTFLIGKKEFNLEKNSIIPIYNQLNETDSFRVFDFDNNGQYEILFEIDDPDFGFKSYLIAYKILKNRLVPINFISSKDTFSGLTVMNYLCLIDSKGQIFIHSNNVLTKNMMYTQVDKYVYDSKKKAFVYVGMKLFSNHIKKKSEVIW